MDFQSDQVQETAVLLWKHGQQWRIWIKIGGASDTSLASSLYPLFPWEPWPGDRWWWFWFLVEGEVSWASPDHRHRCRLRTEGREGAVLLNSNDQSDSRKWHIHNQVVNKRLQGPTTLHLLSRNKFLNEFSTEKEFSKRSLVDRCLVSKLFFFLAKKVYFMANLCSTSRTI